MTDVHPIQCGALGRDAETRIRTLEEALAILWDQVWWLSLPTDQRDVYRREGFDDPIRRFYVPLEQIHGN